MITTNSMATLVGTLALLAQTSSALPISTPHSVSVRAPSATSGSLSTWTSTLVRKALYGMVDQIERRLPAVPQHKREFYNRQASRRSSGSHIKPVAAAPVKRRKMRRSSSRSAKQRRALGQAAPAAGVLMSAYVAPAESSASSTASAVHSHASAFNATGKVDRPHTLPAVNVSRHDAALHKLSRASHATHLSHALEALPTLTVTLTLVPDAEGHYVDAAGLHSHTKSHHHHHSSEISSAIPIATASGSTFHRSGVTAIATGIATLSSASEPIATHTGGFRHQ